MMSKYQKALENIGMTVIDSLSNGYDSPKYVKDFCYGDYNILQELVDKATPKKHGVKQRKGYRMYICRSCGGIVYKDNYCGHCGQALDWSDE